MEITLTDKNGRKIKFDTAAYNPAKHDAYIQQNIASIDPVMLPNGKAVKIDPAKFNSAHIQYLQSPAVQPAPEPERGTIEKVGRAAGRFGLGALEKATNIGFGIQTPMAWVMGERAQENLRKDREITKEMFDKNIDALGGRDIWSSIGGIVVELAGSGGVRAGAVGVAKKAGMLKSLTPAVKAAVAAGDKGAIWNLAGRLGAREAILEGISWGAIRAAAEGNLATGAKEALFAGATGGLFGGAGVRKLVKGAKAGMAAEKTAAEAAAKQAAIDAERAAKYKIPTTLEEMAESEAQASSRRMAEASARYYDMQYIRIVKEADEAARVAREAEQAERWKEFWAEDPNDPYIQFKANVADAIYERFVQKFGGKAVNVPTTSTKPISTTTEALFGPELGAKAYKYEEYGEPIFYGESTQPMRRQ